MATWVCVCGKKVRKPGRCKDCLGKEMCAVCMTRSIETFNGCLVCSVCHPNYFRLKKVEVRTECIECGKYEANMSGSLCKACIEYFTGMELEKEVKMASECECARCYKCGHEFNWLSSSITTTALLCGICARKEGYPAVSDLSAIPIERKEVLMKHCSLCQREFPSAGPESGIGYKSEVLCGTCLKAAQKVCPHSLRKEDGITCRDCGARPWTTGRIVRGILGGVKSAAVGFAKLFVMYTISSIMGSIVTLGLAYLLGRKMGFLP